MPKRNAETSAIAVTFTYARTCVQSGVAKCTKRVAHFVYAYKYQPYAPGSLISNRILIIVRFSGSGAVNRLHEREPRDLISSRCIDRAHHWLRSENCIGVLVMVARRRASNSSQAMCIRCYRERDNTAVNSSAISIAAINIVNTEISLALGSALSCIIALISASPGYFNCPLFLFPPFSYIGKGNRY